VGLIFVIALEVISAAIMVTKSPNLNSQKNILGIKIAQAPDQPADAPPAETQPPTDNNSAPSSTSSPADSTSTQPSQEPAPTTNETQPQNSPTDQSTGTNTPAPSPEGQNQEPNAQPVDPFASNSTDQYQNQNVTSPTPESNQTNTQTPAPTPQDQSTSKESPTPSPENNADASPSPTTIDFSPNQTTAVLEPDQLLSTPDSISEKTNTQVKQEEEKFSQAATPKEQTDLLVGFAKDKINEINTTSQNNDYASLNFSALRLNSQIQKIQELAKNLPPNENLSLNKQLQNFCRQSDFTLKSTQLTVPESSEQDIEITRGTCLSINL